MAITDIYFTIGQVSDHTELPQSVLRYWETVFDVLNPVKSAGGNRRYTTEDIEIIKEIKILLYDQGFTIKGANRKLNDEHGIDVASPNLGISGEIYLKEPQDSLKYDSNTSGRSNQTRNIIAELKKIIAIFDE